MLESALGVNFSSEVVLVQNLRLKRRLIRRQRAYLKRGILEVYDDIHRLYRIIALSISTKYVGPS